MSKEVSRNRERSAIDNDFLVSKLRPAENSLGSPTPKQGSESSLARDIGHGEGIIRLMRAYHNRLQEATPDDAFEATDILLGKLADDIEQGWTPGAVKQHGSGWRFRARDIKIEDSNSWSGADE
jgi:hypothetical protein